MVYLSLLLHFYQPPTQFPKITKKIAKESYEKILKILKRKNVYPPDRQARLTVNFSASLTEQLARLGLSGVIKGFAGLAREGRVEFTGSAAYHPLLPKIPRIEMERQIKLNEEINQKYFGPFGRLRVGFFPPEMAYSPEVGEIVERLGYKWIILDESAIKTQNSNVKSQNYNSKLKTKDTSDGGQYHSSEVDGKQTIHAKKNSNLAVFIRDRELSLAIAFSKITNVSQLLEFLETERYSFKEDSYIIVALDGETFGHHQPEQLKFLEEIFKWNMEHEAWNMVTISELLKLFPKRQEIEPKESTWGDGWGRWDNPKNPIHKLQWRLYNLALKIGSQGDARLLARSLLDRALHSDQFWWASHSPCWHPKMIERGARMLRDVVLLNPVVNIEKKEEVKKLYNEIILTGRRLYGEKIIPC